MDVALQPVLYTWRARRGLPDGGGAVRNMEEPEAGAQNDEDINQEDGAAHIILIGSTSTFMATNTVTQPAGAMAPG